MRGEKEIRDVAEREGDGELGAGAAAAVGGARGAVEARGAEREAELAALAQDPRAALREVPLDLEQDLRSHYRKRIRFVNGLW